MSVAVICDACGMVGPVAPLSHGHAIKLAEAAGWKYGRRDVFAEGWTASQITDVCPACQPT